MLYREAGQFKSTYAADMAVFPIRQDRIALALLLLFAFVGIPAMAQLHIWPFGSDYLLRAILIPFLILALAAIGVNILIGYCGQISLGSGAFMAIGAYSAYSSRPASSSACLAWDRHQHPAPSGAGVDHPRRSHGGTRRHPLRRTNLRIKGFISRWRRSRPSSSSTGFSFA